MKVTLNLPPPDAPPPHMPPPGLPAFDWQAAADSVVQAPPAIWVPLRRALRARRRLAVMARELPAQLWQAPSACPAWTRADAAAHVAASDRRYHDALTAALNGRPLEEWSPDPGLPSAQLDDANRLALDGQPERAPLKLAQALEIGAQKTLMLCCSLTEDQSLQRMGWAANGPALIEWWEAHDHQHADDIINGPTMMQQR